jgi:hypothetical protein
MPSARKGPDASPVRQSIIVLDTCDMWLHGVQPIGKTFLVRQQFAPDNIR